jgi:hypothetical protein
VTDIQMDEIETIFLDLAVDGAGHDIARGSSSLSSYRA